MNRKILIAAAAALAVPAALAGVWDHPAPRRDPTDAANTQVLGYSPRHMDRKADPRQDFYRYANGRWLDAIAIPGTSGDIGGFSLLKEQIDNQLFAIVREAARSKAPAGTPRQQVGDFYRAAMDTKRIEARGLDPVREELALIDKADTPAALGALLARQQLRLGASPLVNLFASQDARDNTRMRLVVYAGIQGLDPDEYAKPDGQRVRDLYRDYLGRTFATLGDDAAKATERAGRVLDLETALVAGRLGPIEMRDPRRTYNIMPFAEAQALVPAVDLTAAAKALGIAVPAEVQVLDPGSLKATQQLLATRPAEDVKSLLRWHAITSRAGQLGEPWHGNDIAFARERKGLAASPSREKDTVAAIGSLLHAPLSRLYVEKHFPESKRRQVVQMVDHIRAEFEIRLKANPWLDDATRAAALDKLSKIDVQVGYPREWIDFSDVEIRADDYAGNIERINAASARREFAQLAKGPMPSRFSVPTKTTPISVNAAYSPVGNNIDISAVILQPPFYLPKADLAVNYCTMGAVIGHELTHGFDSQGRQYDPAGNWRDWWTPRADAAFQQRTQVLVEQYGDFTLLPGLKHNGQLTITENTADLGGITLAHAALQRALKGRRAPKVDGLTTDQRCFVAWSQLWAYKARPERIRTLAATDAHANNRLRGFAPLVHLDAFHKAFGTRPGDAMWRDPARRVTIW